jgi:hypothetical protein
LVGHQPGSPAVTKEILGIGKIGISASGNTERLYIVGIIWIGLIVEYIIIIKIRYTVNRDSLFRPLSQRNLD